MVSASFIFTFIDIITHHQHHHSQASVTKQESSEMKSTSVLLKKIKHTDNTKQYFAGTITHGYRERN